MHNQICECTECASQRSEVLGGTRVAAPPPSEWRKHMAQATLMSEVKAKYRRRMNADGTADLMGSTDGGETWRVVWSNAPKGVTAPPDGAGGDPDEGAPLPADAIVQENALLMVRERTTADLQVPLTIKIPLAMNFTIDGQLYVVGCVVEAYPVVSDAGSVDDELRDVVTSYARRAR